MDSESDRKARESAYAQRKGRVVEDERGRRIWKDTIRQVKFSLMKTGIFVVSESQRRLMKFRGEGTDDTGDDLDLDEDLELSDGGSEFDPYNSNEK